MKEEQRIYMKKIGNMEAKLKEQKENLEKMKELITENEVVLNLQEIILNTISNAEGIDKETLLKDYENNKIIHEDMKEKYEHAKGTVAANEMMLNVLKEAGQYDKLYDEWLNEAVQELIERDRNNIC